MRILLVCAAVPSSPGHVAELAAAVDAVFAVDGGASACLSAGVRPDLVVGDLDSLDSASRLVLKADRVPFDTYPADKDVSDLDLALQRARTLGASEVIVTGAFSARLDHTLVALGSLARACDLQPVISEPELSGWVLCSAERSSVHVAGAGATISILPLLDSALVSATGVRWPLEGFRLQPLSSLGLSNVVGAGVATISVSEGTAVILSPLVGERIAQQVDEIAT